VKLPTPNRADRNFEPHFGRSDANTAPRSGIFDFWESLVVVPLPQAVGGMQVAGSTQRTKLDFLIQQSYFPRTARILGANVPLLSFQELK
jgi:hypothetical protein